ncbi:MAG TPA: serine/threonine-protein phosphatase [Tissierellia bacterium]|nr:serine/threonine-protein phosphatase [Tissierellia bacterium]
MKSFGLTNIGNYRLKNDDSFYCSDGKKGIYIVADGMGGYRGGEVASRLAVRSALDVMKQRSVLTPALADQVIGLIQEKLRQEIKRNPDLSDMGTTLICCVSDHNDMTCMHIGDSRAYHYSRGRLSQLTEDHTLVNILYKNGVIRKDELKSHPQRNVLMKSITANETVEPDIFSFELGVGEFLLLCSDGLTEQMTRKQLEKFFEEDDEPSVIGEKLVDEALRLGGRDNIAVVVIRG